MVLAYDFYKSFWIINPNLTLDMFLGLVGAKKGYSLNMFERIYKSIFSELIDVEDEYNKFHFYEYSTFEDYLYKKYNIEKQSIKSLMEKRKAFPESRIYRKDDNSYGNYQIPTFIDTDVMRERIFNILNLNL